MKNDEHILREIKELRKEVDELRQRRLDRSASTEPSPVATEEQMSEASEESVSTPEWAELEKILSDLVSTTQEEISDHPAAAIAIAVLLGFTLGRST